jgi:hypothetical protein
MYLSSAVSKTGRNRRSVGTCDIEGRIAMSTQVGRWPTLERRYISAGITAINLGAEFPQRESWIFVRDQVWKKQRGNDMFSIAA